MKRHFVVLGAGISGLALGWFLRERFGDDISLTILEKSPHEGGWIRSQYCQDFLFENGPRSCRTKGNGIATLQLIESLGLQADVIAASPSAQQRFLYIDNKLQKLPSGLFSFLKSPLMQGMLPGLYRDWRFGVKCDGDESVYHFISRRLGHDIAERLMDPLVSGIYAGNIRQLSMQACFPDIFNKVKSKGSILNSMWAGLFKKADPQKLSPFVRTAAKHPLFTLRQGMGMLTKSLAEVLKNCIMFNCSAKSLVFNHAKVEIDIGSGQTLYADHVFSAVPDHALRHLIDPLKVLVPVVPGASVAVVNMGWKEKVLNRQGFGYLVPSSEKEDVLGVVWDSEAFPQQNGSREETRLTVMLGGVNRPDIPLKQEDEIIELALKAISRHLGIKRCPDVIRVSIAIDAIPQYQVGHTGRVNELREKIDDEFGCRLHLAGSSWDGVSVNDCVANAKKMANFDFAL